MSTKKIIIVNYYGKLPVYASYFFESCKKNSSYHFIIFNDIHTTFIDKNVQFIKSTILDFNARATAMLGIPIALDRGFKVCDLRPAYGVIYGDLIKDFDFWGFCDLDTILGRLDDFLTNDFLETIDVYSSKPLWNSGSFSLYRNTERVNNLFRITDDWKMIFSTSKYFGFDECLQRWDGIPIKITHRITEVLSIYDLIHSDETIRACYTDSVIEWPEDIIKLKWSDGKWLDLRNGKEFLYFHLLLMKNSWRFYQPKLDFSHEIFVTGLGISEQDHDLFTIKSLVWKFNRAISCFFGIIRSLSNRLTST